MSSNYQKPKTFALIGEGTKFSLRDIGEVVFPEKGLYRFLFQTDNDVLLVFSLKTFLINF